MTYYTGARRKLTLRKVEVDKPAAAWKLPYSNFRNVWVFVMVIVVIYNTFVTPVRVSIIGNNDGVTILSSLDYLFDVFFLVDMCLSFMFAYVDEDTQIIVTDRAAISSRYLHSWFLIDFVAVLPGILEPIAGAVPSMYEIRSKIGVLRMIRALHLYPQFM
jgi:hypothetical protein